MKVSNPCKNESISEVKELFYFSAVINGVEWTSQKDGSAVRNNKKGGIVISAQGEGVSHFNFYIQEKLLSGQHIDIKDNCINVIASYKKGNTSYGTCKYREGTIVGSIDITEISETKLSATFEFEAINDANEMVEINDGRFSVLLMDI